jgi:YHS domain-containing protein
LSVPNLTDCINKTCPWSGKPVAADSLASYRGQVVGFCNPGCREKFEKAIGDFDALLDRNDAGPDTVS